MGFCPGLVNPHADSVEYAVETKIEGAAWLSRECARVKRLQQSRITPRVRLDCLSQFPNPLYTRVIVFSYLLECGVAANVANEGPPTRTKSGSPVSAWVKAGRAYVIST
jgi:hypothetical protein